MIKTTLRLSNLIGMMNRNMIRSAMMDIKALSQVFTRHGTTFDMPSWKPFSSWRISFHLSLSICRWKLPKSKICWIFFTFHLDSLSSIEISKSFFVIWPHKLTIVWDFGSIHIDSISCYSIGISFIFQGLNQSNLLSNMISSSWHHIKAINIKLCNIGEKKFFIFFCNIPSRRRF